MDSGVDSAHVDVLFDAVETEGDDNEDEEVWKAYMLAWIVSSFSMSCLFWY